LVLGNPERSDASNSKLNTQNSKLLKVIPTEVLFSPHARYAGYVYAVDLAPASGRGCNSCEVLYSPQSCAGGISLILRNFAIDTLKGFRYCI